MITCANFLIYRKVALFGIVLIQPKSSAGISFVQLWEKNISYVKFRLNGCILNFTCYFRIDLFVSFLFFVTLSSLFSDPPCSNSCNLAHSPSIPIQMIQNGRRLACWCLGCACHSDSDDNSQLFGNLLNFSWILALLKYLSIWYCIITTTPFDQLEWL